MYIDSFIPGIGCTHQQLPGNQLLNLANHLMPNLKNVYNPRRNLSSSHQQTFPILTLLNVYKLPFPATQPPSSSRWRWQGLTDSTK
jgi:hypothetical protein